jgi:hypothetical protein
MRTLVQPPSSQRCDFCHGELQLQRIDPDGPRLEWDIAMLVCAKCKQRQLHRVYHDPYAAHSASSGSLAKAG